MGPAPSPYRAGYARGVAPWAGRPLGFPGFSNRRPSPAAAVGAGGSAPRLGLGGELDRLFLARRLLSRQQLGGVESAGEF